MKKKTLKNRSTTHEFPLRFILYIHIQSIQHIRSILVIILGGQKMHGINYWHHEKTTTTDSETQ